MVAVAAGQVSALGTVDIAGEIKALGVAPDMRGKKLGQKLLYSLEEKAKNADKPFVWVQKNIQSSHFFVRCGYKETEDKLIKYFYREGIFANEQEGGGFDGGNKE
jgi:N-acetylglutamate synthase-like GNAT family acetyltransferase